MSLFKVRDWWSARSGQEYYAANSLCINNLDNSSDKYDKIAIGSLNGILRIYNPHRPGNTSNQTESFLDYRASDLILEVQLKEPILQILFGAFVSGNTPKGNQLAILHPRRLVVSTLSSAKGAVDHGYQFQLSQLYEHQLDRSAFNMCCGPFGGAKSKDYIAVQSVDCTLTIFEHEHGLFSRFLPNSLLPGPIVYWPVSNSFLTVSSSWLLESYRFETLAVATDAKTKEEAQSAKTAKKITPDWALNIGEAAIQIEVTLLPAGASSGRAIVLGERNLFCVNDVGELVFSIKMDYNPISVFVTKNTQSSIDFIVANHFKSLMFYENEILKWSAHSSILPTAFGVGNLKALRGAIVMLASEGQLTLGYLGTDPTLFSVAPPAAGRDIKWDDYERDMKKLDEKIRESSKPVGINSSKTANAEEEVTIKVQISKEISSTNRNSGFQSKIPGQVLLSIKRSQVDDVRLHILAQAPISVDPISTKIGRLDQSSPVTVKFTLAIDGSSLASNLNVKFAASYSIKGSPRLVSSNLELPIRSLSKPKILDGGIKAATDPTAVCKMTIDSNMAPVPIAELFSDYSIENQPPESITADVGGFNVSILAAKNSNRYRVQGPTLSACSLFMLELANRLMQRRGQILTFSENFPLEDIATAIANHIEARNNLTTAESRLAAASSQIIAVEKRLLSRVRDKNPSMIDDMHLLLANCQKEVNEAIDDVDKAKRLETSAGAALAAAIRAFCLLVKLWRQLSDEEYAVLLTVLQPDIISSNHMQHGWEELADTAIVYLLRSVLSPRNENSRDAVFNPPPLAPPTDRGESLMKHLKMLLDRLSKGGRLVSNVDETSQSNSNQSLKLASRNPLQNYLDESSASSETGITKSENIASSGDSKHKKVKQFKKSAAAAADQNEQATLNSSLKSLPPSAVPVPFSINKNDTILPDLSALPAINAPRSRESKIRPPNRDDGGGEIPDLDSL